ncbi:hypothetical protein IMSAGC011_03392 [Lachnospiraceae bacterium]|nr:hypothetical protein IMSAGC011_03392 [Lachnospiraceae bacterium]
MRLQSWTEGSASCSLEGLDHSSPISLTLPSTISTSFCPILMTRTPNALDIEKYVKNLCKARVRDNDTVDEVEDAGVIEA